MNHRGFFLSFDGTGAWPVFILVAVLASGCAAGRANLEDTALAFLNGEPVTVRDLEEGFESSHQGHGALLAGEGAVREFLNPTIDRRLLIQEARRIGLDRDPGVRQQVKKLEAERARDLLYKEEVTRYQQVPEKAIEAVYPKILYRYRVRHILTYTREDAEKALARVRGGEPFGAVASEMSVSSTAGRGGDLGFLTWGQLDPRLEAEIESMKPGEIRAPIETDQGWNVLLLEEKEQREGELPELAKLKSRIKMILGRRAVSRRSVEFYHQLRAQWKVQIFDQALTAQNLLSGQKDEPDPGQAKQIVVAVAGDHTFTLADLRARVNPAAVKRLPESWALKQLRGILDEMIFASLLEQEALRRGYGTKPAIAAEVGKLEDALVLDRLATTVIYPRIQVTDEEAKAFYDQNPGPFTEPEAVRLQIVVLRDAAEAEAVLREAQAGADFAALARRHSKDPGTAQVGGELGWIVRGSLDPAVEAVAFSLKVGEVAQSKNDKAFFVVRLQERRAARLQDFAHVKGKAREMLLKRRQREEIKRWVSRLREASEIVIEDAAIARVTAAYQEEVKQKAAGAGKADIKAAPVE